MKFGFAPKKKKIEPVLGRGAARQRTSPMVMLAPSGKKKLRFPPRRIIAGLRWLMPRDAARGKDGAMRMALQPEFAADFVAIRETAVYEQFGLGWTGGVEMKPRPFERWEAGAAALADTLGEPKWIGVWPVKDAGGKNLWWFVGVNADELLPDGDVLFNSEDAATERVISELQNLNQGSDDTIVFAPQSWAIKNSREESWEEILDRAHGPRVQIVQEPHDDTRQKVGVVVGAVVIFGGAFWGISHFGGNTPTPAAAPARQAASPPPPPAPVQERKVAAPPPPPASETAAKADLWISDCLSAAGPIFHPAPGWLMKKVGCAGTAARVEFEREPGGLHDWLIRAVASQPAQHGKALSFQDQSHAVLTAPMSERPGRGPEALWRETETVQWFAALAERTGLAIETHVISAAPPPASSGPAAIAGLISTVEPQTPPAYHAIGFSIVSPFSPEHWNEWLAEIPGLQMTGLKAPVDNQILGDWTLEGVIYVGL